MEIVGRRSGFLKCRKRSDDNHPKETGHAILLTFTGEEVLKMLSR